MPTILFIGGSGFTPLFVNGGCVALPFNCYRFLDSFNFIIVGKPGIPIFSDSSTNQHINKTAFEGWYLSPNGFIPPIFIKNNNLNYYYKSYSCIFKYLEHQSWIDKSKIYIVAHSQGASIALSLAEHGLPIRKLALLSPGNPINRFYEFIREVRQGESFQQYSPEEAQKKIDSIYHRYKTLLKQKSNHTQKYDSFSYYSYYSFVHPTRIEQLLKTKQSTLICYGTDGVKDIEWDYLPIFLTDKPRKNITLRAYPGYDHNYFKSVYDQHGNIINRQFHWDDVINDVIGWFSH